MVQNAGNFAKQCPDPLRSFWHLNVQQLLYGQREALLVRHHGDIVQTVEVGQCLKVGLVLNELLRTTVQETDVRVCAHNLFTIQLQDQAQHTVGSWMLRAKVHSVMSDLALVWRVRLVVGSIH